MTKQQILTELDNLVKQCDSLAKQGEGKNLLYYHLINNVEALVKNELQTK